MINFVVIGGGWRAEFYIRIAKALPGIFNLSGVCVRNPKRAEYISQKYNVKISGTIDELLKEPFDFVVNCINKEDITELSLKLAEKGYYVLSETPVTKDMCTDCLCDKIQVAEHFHLKGTYQALKKIIDSKIIGDVNYINISTCHDYHAMSLIKYLLDDYEKPQLLYGSTIDDKMLKTNGREGVLPEKKILDTEQQIKIYKFKKATVVYDYNKEQYFSPIRKDRILIRGTNGEIENNNVRYFNSDKEFVSEDIKTVMSGLLDGFYFDKIIFNGNVVFDYPFKQARLSEEEIAIAHCLVKMKEYTDTGKEFYSFKKAFEDYAFFNGN